MRCAPAAASMQLERGLVGRSCCRLPTWPLGAMPGPARTPADLLRNLPPPPHPTALPAAGMETSLALSGSQPNHVTYSAAITACARMADWRRALELKDHMLAR